MYTLGIDIGSASSKALILKDGTEIIASSVFQRGTGSTGPDRAINAALTEAGVTTDDVALTVATGYGRMHCDIADKQMSEISCHAKGVFFSVPQARTVIDIGGQDAKTIFLDDAGRVQQFFMNDKCAAGTGRFLDVMAGVLETDIDLLGELDEKSNSPAEVSSTCTVFAESEVISLLSNNVKKEDIAAGVNRSVAIKAAALARRGTVRAAVVMSGGVARNKGVVGALSDILKMPVEVAPDSQTMGALGAALYAYEDVRKGEK